MTNFATLPASDVPRLLEALREGTRAAHERIELVPAMCCLLSPDLSATAYGEALGAIHAFRAAMKIHLAPFLPALSEAAGPDPLVLNALAEDLAWFGLVVPPPYDGTLHLADAQAALGALYVVEGSALGGRVIGRAVARSLGVSPGRGGSFFCGTTADAARQRWLNFSVMLERAGEGLNQQGVLSVVAGANATFSYLERFLRGGPSDTAKCCPGQHERSAKSTSSVRALAIAQAI
jgi:heme oxygenase